MSERTDRMALLRDRTKHDLAWGWFGLKQDLKRWPRRWDWYDRLWWRRWQKDSA